MSQFIPMHKELFIDDHKKKLYYLFLASSYADFFEVDFYADE